MTKVKNSPRHRARELVLKSLYALDCGTADPEKSFNEISADVKLPERQLKFARDLFDICKEQVHWADKQIGLLAKNWRIERINYIDRNILRMAIIELQFMPDSPTKVVINEAIELAKTFSTHESSGFVNGILDTFSKSLANQV